MQFFSKNKKWVLLLLVLVLVGVGVKFFGGKNNADKKNTITIATMGDLSSLDIHKVVGGLWEHVILQDLYSGLFEKAANGDVIPAMAESYKITNGGKTYTFKIRDSKWSDGVPVTAHDFEFAFKRGLSAELASGYASLLFVIKNGEQYNAGKVTVDQVGVKALDDKTLRVDLEYPAAFLTTVMTHYMFYPVPKHVVEKLGNDWSKTNMVSNGAYQFVEWKLKSFIKAKRNEHFWDSKNTKIENVVYYTQEDRAAILKRFRAGEIDIADDFASDQYEWLKKNMPQETRVSAFNAVFYLTVNVNKGALQNKNVRQALSMAIDREFITDKVLKSGEIPTYSFVTLGLEGYKPASFKWANLAKEEKLKKAKELMQSAGYSKEKPLNIELAYTTNENDKKIVVAVADMWKEIGVNVVTNSREVNIHYKELQQQNFEVGRARWVGDYEEPSTYLDLLNSNNTMNYGKYANPKVDELVNTGKATVNTEKRNALYKEAEALILEDAAVIPIFYFTSKVLVNQRVEGWKPNTGNLHQVRFMSIKE